MKFLCLGYFEPVKMDALPAGGSDAVMAKCMPHMATIHQTGAVLVDVGLNLDATMLRRVDGEVQVVRGRNTPRPETVGAVFIIEAPDLDEAIRIARLHPTTQLEEGEALGWSLEVRAIDHYFAKP